MSHTSYWEWITYHFILRINHKPFVPEIQSYGTVLYFCKAVPNARVVFVHASNVLWYRHDWFMIHSWYIHGTFVIHFRYKLTVQYIFLYLPKQISWLLMSIAHGRSFNMLHLWYISDAFMIHIWYIHDTYMIHTWYIHDTYMIHTWYYMMYSFEVFYVFCFWSVWRVLHFQPFSILN